MRLLRAAAHRRMPWKNGGGVTTEIAVFPPGAGLDDFDWRISMARVDCDGPFSLFPGVDRTLMLLDGEGLHLSVEGREPFHLARPYQIAAFPADAPASANLEAGPITDLNVMTRRGVCTAEINPLRVSGGHRLDATAAATLLLADAEGLQAEVDGRPVALGCRDALVLDRGETAVLRAPFSCAALVIAIRMAEAR